MNKEFEKLVNEFWTEMETPCDHAAYCGKCPECEKELRKKYPLSVQDEVRKRMNQKEK